MRSTEGQKKLFLQSGAYENKLYEISESSVFQSLEISDKVLFKKLLRRLLVKDYMSRPSILDICLEFDFIKHMAIEEFYLDDEKILKALG